MKRYFLALPLFFFLFSALFSAPAHAISCCSQGVAPSGGCIYGVPMQCVDPEPLCDLASNTCIPLVNDICGAYHQPCCGGTPRCEDDLVCVFPGQSYESCFTPEEVAQIPGNSTPGLFIWPTRSGGIGELFCIPGDRDSGIMTAIGCISTSSPKLFTGTILNLVTALGGGLALALILYGVFIVTTSGGNPDKLKMGSEIITSAVIGLIFILLSVFLMNLIGINILALPGLS